MILEIISMALDHNLFIAVAIIVAVIFFLLVAIFSINKKGNRASSILKFAPSVLTSLGLLGTFLALTTSLVGLKLNESGNISNESLSVFIKSLESVFSFSIMGIGSAIIFMVINFLILAYRNGHLSAQKTQFQTNLQNRQAKTDEINQSTLQELKSQSYHLTKLAEISTTSNRQSDHLKAISAHTKSQLHIQSHQDEQQRAIFESLNDSMGRMQRAITNMETGYDMDKLGEVVSQKIGEVLTQPLADMTTALEKNNSDVIHQLLADLKQDILIPIKDEIQTTNTTTNQVVEAVRASQQTNTQLIEELSRVSTQMDGFVTNTQILVGSMSSTVEKMQTVQDDQDKTLKEFNHDLKQNLDSIKPAIEEGMDTAKQGMVDAIEKVTDKMNTAMTGVITRISNDVVTTLGGVLETFDNNMDGHLTRMNNELEQTGKHSSDLIDSSAKHLKETLGSIDKTLDESSTKLKNELEAFRTEYQFSLDTFFTRQNEALEKTLGVQNERLQKTADQLGEQFRYMADAQRDLNGEAQSTIKTSKVVYEPLLTQVSAITRDLNQGQSRLASDLRDVFDHTQDINEALEDLGKQLPKEFAKAFETLNDTYIDKFESSNKALHSIMNEMISASAVLLTANNSNQDDK